MITILDVMGDFTDIKTLGVVSCCSKQAKRLIAPLLEKKIQNACEMRQVVLQTFPLIKELPDVDAEHGADYFKGLLTRYFTAPARTKFYINLDIGSIMGLFYVGYNEIYDYMKEEMYSSLGRRRVLECIDELRQEADPTIMHPTMILVKLQLIENFIRNDFQVPGDRINSRFGPVPRHWSRMP